jgi:hypothetical protein
MLLGDDVITKVVGGDHQSIVLVDAWASKLGAAMCECLAQLECRPMAQIQLHRAA